MSLIKERNQEKLFVVVALVMLVAWEGFVKFFASIPILHLIVTFQLDKFFHVIGGAFLAGVFLLLSRNLQLLQTLLLVLVFAVFFEVLEFLFDGEVIDFFYNRPDLWVGDLVGDIIAGLAGAVLYWKATLGRKKVTQA